PLCVLHWGEFRGQMTIHYVLEMEMGAGVLNHLTPTLGWLGHRFVYQLGASLPYVLGWPLHALALLGVGLALVRRELGDRVLVVQLVAYFLVIGSAAGTFPRYLMPLLPILV